jgi:hypothetical protein
MFFRSEPSPPVNAHGISESGLRVQLRKSRDVLQRLYDSQVTHHPIRPHRQS